MDMDNFKWLGEPSEDFIYYVSSYPKRCGEGISRRITKKNKEEAIAKYEELMKDGSKDVKIYKTSVASHKAQMLRMINDTDNEFINTDFEFIEAS